MTTTYTSHAVSPAAFAATGQQATGTIHSSDPTLDGKDAPVVTTIAEGEDTPSGVVADKTLVKVGGTPRTGFTFDTGADGLLGALSMLWQLQQILTGNVDDAAVLGDVDGSVSAKLRGLSQALADVWDQTQHRLTVNTASGVAVAFSAPLAALIASTDTVFTFASQVKHVYLENKSTTDAYFNLDAAASLGTFWLPANGGIRGLDVPCTALHLYSIAPTPVNGGSALNIVARGWS